jgi:hypothetical protein
MDTKHVIGSLLVVLVLAIVVTVAVALIRLELSMIYTLALIIAAASLPIRAHRSSSTQEREIIRERHTIDGRRDPRIISMPAAKSSPGADIFPHLLRGLANDRQRRLTYDEGGAGNGETDTTSVDDRVWRGPIKQ